MEKQTINLSALQHTEVGRVVCDMYLLHILDVFIKDGERYGSLWNGGSHTLYLYTTKDDILAFIELVEEILTKSSYHEAIRNMKHDVYTQLGIIR